MTGSKVSNKSSVTAAVIKRKVRGWTVALKLSVKDRTGTGKTSVTLTMECAAGWQDSVSPLLRGHCTHSRAAVLGDAAEGKTSETLKAGETNPCDDADT